MKPEVWIRIVALEKAFFSERRSYIVIFIHYFYTEKKMSGNPKIDPVQEKLHQNKENL